MRRLDSKDTWGAERLEAELEIARDGLRGLDRDIRKILGRDLPDGENATIQSSPRIGQKRPLQEDRKRNTTDYSSNDQKSGQRRWQMSVAAEPKTVFSRLSARVPSTADDSGDDDDNTNKPAVSSRVIATPREIPSRQEVIRRERVDERSRQRNKRMFGALLGTLQKFRQEETKLKAKEDKKAEVEARVEEAKRREKEELRRERQQLFLSRKRQLAEVRALETKLARTRQFNEWRAAQLPLASFIRTNAQPPIYYLPKKKNPKTDLSLAQCAKELHEEIEKREKSLMDELEVIEAQINIGKQQNIIDDVTSVQNDDATIDDDDDDDDDDDNDDNDDDHDDDVVVPPIMMEIGEENRDPNPDNYNNEIGLIQNESQIKVEKQNDDKHETIVDIKPTLIKSEVINDDVKQKNNDNQTGENHV